MKRKKIKKIFTLVILPLGLLVANLYIVFPIFSGRITSWPGSIETAYIAVARFIKEFFPHISWNPYWYNGYPFHTFYNPILPYLEAIISVLTSLSIPKVYRIITGLAYSLAPVSFYFLVLTLSQSWLAALPASLAFSFFPSLVYQFTPYTYEVGEKLNFPPWRLNALSLYGEGPHTFSLVFTPIALAFSLKALRNKDFKNILLAAIFIAIVALTNMIGIMSFSLLFLLLLFVESRTRGKTSGIFRVAAKIILLTFGLIAFWYNLSFIKLSFFFGQGGTILDAYLTLFPFGWIAVIWILGLVYTFVKIKKAARAWILVAFWILLFGIISWFGYAQDRALLPQPKRYVPYFDMGLYLLLGLVVDLIGQKLAKVKAFGKILSLLLVVTVCIVIIWISLPFLSTAWEVTKPELNYQNWSEYRNARWFDFNTTDERIYTTGNTAFWMNTFFPEVEQVKGSLDQAATGRWWDHMQYQIYHGEDDELAINMLKILNASYILVNLPGSADLYKDFTYPEKFAKLEPVWSATGDIIYKVPLEDRSFAKVVDLNKLRALKEPFNGADKPAFLAYLNWLEENPGLATLQKINNDHYQIQAKVTPHQAVLVQMTYDPGWRAKANQGRVAIKKDLLGYLLIEPSVSGDLAITLSHGRTWDIWLGYLITLMTLGYLGYVFYFSRSQK